MAMNMPIDMTGVAAGASETRTVVVALIAGAGCAQEVQLGALAALRDSGLGLALLLADPASPQCHADVRRLLEKHRPVGAVLAPPASATGEFAALCREMACPYVAIAPDAREVAAHLVCSNDRQGAKDATQYLIALGHRRIGFVAGPEHCRTSRERELGYIDALAEHGLDLGAELVAHGDLAAASGRENGLLLLEVSPLPHRDPRRQRRNGRRRAPGRARARGAGSRTIVGHGFRRRAPGRSLLAAADKHAAALGGNGLHCRDKADRPRPCRSATGRILLRTGAAGIDRAGCGIAQAKTSFGRSSNFG